MAEFVTSEAPKQDRDTLGLAAGVIFAVVGLTYLLGGNRAVSDNWGLLLPAILVLLGVAGLAGSGLVRGWWHPAQTEPTAAAEPEA